MSKNTAQITRQYRIILSADTASEVRQLLSQKRRQYFVYWRAFWQRRCRAAHRAAARRFGAQPTLCGGSWRGDPPERCLSRQAGIVRYCLKYIQKSPPAKQLTGLFFGFLGFRLVAHVRYRVHGDERPGVFAVHEVHQLLVLALVHDGDDLAAFFHVVGTVGFIHRGPAVQVG